ncbi:uncharacterized protein LOC105666924 [Bombus terrestris]|uniref:Uncharacterized protein LOC105666924 n=1 Tax=Bombus terrestris TaxID=30195 RepID=A0A9B2MRA7_BOMTE|nr:uncharacterized protein LOC105666924 [Bombus terrestris]
MNLMTEEFAESLGIKRKRCAVPIGTLDNLTTIAKRHITATLTFTDDAYEWTLSFLVIPTISTLIPNQRIDRSLLDIPRNLRLADTRFHIPAPIDVLLSSGSTLASMCVGQIILTKPDEPELRLQKTRFGWVIGGSPTSQTATSTFHASTTALQADVKRFWEIDEGQPTTHLSESERQCKEYFRNHVQRTREGRCILSLLFNERLHSLGSSKAAAMSKLTSLHRRFQRDIPYEGAYSTVIQECLDLGHMTKINTDHSTKHGYYLPHHGVIKESSDTTKLLVVFDGSASCTTGVSLNDTLHTGPKLQEDLFDILLRFRFHQYVLTGDVEKMYRQILIRPEDRKYQQILWRNSNGEVETYQLNTVTFGLLGAPYLALRSLKQLADDEGHRFPRASSILQRNFYVDDALTGVDTKEEVLSIRKELSDLLQSAGFNIKEWASNDPGILKGLSEQDKCRKLQLGDSQTLKTLGVFWDSQVDAILYAVDVLAKLPRVTKRSISSVIARIYYPLGLLAPVIIRAKIISQRVWLLKIDWDESLPVVLQSEWNRHFSQLALISNIRFPRKTVRPADIKMELHGLCDASEKAYGTCVYLRTVSSAGTIQTRLFTAKSRVAPLKTLTIPRFELSGARRLASLISSVQKALTIKISQIVYWTDSTIVIQWIKSSPHMLKTFEANRVAEVQTKTNISDWRHGSTADNPADLISRDQMPKEFLRPSIWKNGPEWLQQIEALIHLQCIHFSKEIRTLQKDPNTAVGGKLQRLNPFLDNEGILRIGGRLNNSPIPLHQKYLIILPKSSVTELIIDQVHRRNHHSGTQATLYVVRQRYRLVDGRSQVWRTIKRCVCCCRTNPPSVGYLLGDLPESRITESRPFTNIGIDSCCPFYIKEIPSLRDHNRRKVKVEHAHQHTGRRSQDNTTKPVI